jgi:hemoglobin
MCAAGRWSTIAELMARLDRLVLAFVGLAACRSGPRPTPPVPSASLYERLGGIAPLRALVDDLAGRLAADPGLRALYLTTDFAAYKRRLLAELCGATGGPCRTTSGGTPSGAAEAEAWLRHLDEAAGAIGLRPREQGELRRRLERRAAELARDQPG